ncbi:hypothetical protein J3R83DRAFT_11093 [Lanmaoa asiatica]|nr:hypothetical protein J3R83DRAFT_11093 [Lanmaoa asiatica]
MLKKVKSSISGVTHYLLDWSVFPAEDSLDAPTWNEAWGRYLNWLREVSDPEVYDRWHWHYTTLANDGAVRSNFKAILTFDMNMRVSYAAQPFVHKVYDWHLRLLSTKSEVLLPLSSREDRGPPSHRYKPYDPSRKNSRRSHKNPCLIRPWMRCG